MKSYLKLLTAVLALMVSVLVGANLLLVQHDVNDSGRPYRVEASRILHTISESGFDSVDLHQYQYITNVEKLTSANRSSFYEADSDYLIIKSDNEVYRFDYTYSYDNTDNIVIINVCIALISLVCIMILLYIGINIIRPFETIKETPYELAKGHLSIPLKETKGRYFGHFVWGLDLLREKLEQQKQSELKLQKEKKTLILSLSHDIKTPLGIIELYAKALEKNLYTDEKKKQQTAIGIQHQCVEIKDYMNQIITASNEDFLHLEVQEGEFYLAELIRQIRQFYSDKLALLKTEFIIAPYDDCLLKGDCDRAVEVLQNVIENAIKYGDGTTIALSFAAEENCMLISVRNDGCTLSAPETLHIFESFWRGSNVGSNSGSGLGLYICRHLMHQMGGEIFAKNTDGTMTVTAVFEKC